MSTAIIARTSTNADKFDRLNYRSNVALDMTVLKRALGARLVTSLEEVGMQPFYDIDLFTPRGDAYSVSVTQIDGQHDIWAFYGSDEAFFVFCRWYISVGGKAKQIRIRRFAA